MRSTFEEDDADDRYDCDGGDAEYARSQSPVAVPNVQLRGKPLTEDDVLLYNVLDDEGDLEASLWIEDLLRASEEDAPLSPTSQCSQITIGSKLLSQLTKKKREQFLDGELGHERPHLISWHRRRLVKPASVN